MNHKASESRTRITTTNHSHSRIHHTPPLHPSSHSAHDDQVKIRPENETYAEKADRLLAAMLLYYKEASTNSLATINFKNTLIPPSFYELQSFTQQYSLARQFISVGDSILEQTSAKVALLAAPWYTKSIDMAAIDYLFWTIVNLRKPLISFKHSIEANARATFNVVLASIIDGAGVQGCERLLSLCIHLKDTDDCYPLRTLSTSICIEMTCEESLPLYARISMLKFILGPAEFILHHLETRIQLSEKIETLLLKNSYEDVEFRSLIQRVAKKIGSRQPTSTVEQFKFKMYQYLDNAVTDPSRYIRPELISKCMPAAYWGTLPDRDYVVSCYMDEYKPQMLLFLEIIRTMGISPTVLEPIVSYDTLSEGILHVLDGEQQLRSAFSSLIDVFSNASDTFDPDGVQRVLEKVLHTAVKCQDVFEDSQLHKSGAAHQLSIALKTQKGDQIDVSKVRQLHDSMKQLLHSIPLAPGHFLPRLLWTTALCLEVCKELEGAFDPSLPSQDKIQDLKATCLDIFLASVVHRNEPRFPHNTNPSPSATSSTTTHDHLNEDLENCLVLFCLLFPVHKESTWTLFHQPQNTSANDSHARPQPSVYSVFLTRLFEHLLPLLERVDQRSSSSDSTSSSALILAGVTFSLLAFQLPSRTVYNDRAQISKALKDISDLQRDSSLMSTSTLWRHMFGRMSLSNPFDVLESRLATVQ